MFIDCYEEKFSAPLGAEYVAPKGALRLFAGGFYKHLAPNGAMQSRFRGGLLPTLISITRSGGR